MIDWTTPFARKVKRHLRSERIIWLTTVGADGVPRPRPVWYVWDGAEFLIYSKPNMQKLRDIAANPIVALNFNTDAIGDVDVMILTGEARIDSNAPPPHQVPAYVRRYREQMRLSLKMTPRQYSEAFTVAVRIVPVAMRGW